VRQITKIPGALRIALIYVIVALVWIAVSDKVLFAFHKSLNVGVYNIINSGKGFFFVLITGYFLYKLIHADEQKLIETTQKRNQSHNEAKRLESILAEINNIVVITDTDNHISWVNKAFENATGYQFREVAGYSLATFFVDGDTGIEVLSDILAKKQAFESFSADIRCRNKKGEKFWVHCEYSPIFDDSHAFTGYMGVYNDITALKQTVENTTRQNAKLREIAWLSSHEVRRQLVNIIGLSNLIKETPLVNDKLRILENINQAATELDKIVHVLNHSVGEDLEPLAQPERQM
jgi:PAS domain S-box-containing protein